MVISFRNTWKRTTMYKVFLLDRNSWYIIVCQKKSYKITHKKCKYKCIINTILSHEDIK